MNGEIYHFRSIPYMVKTCRQMLLQKKFASEKRVFEKTCYF